MSCSEALLQIVSSPDESVIVVDLKECVLLPLMQGTRGLHSRLVHLINLGALKARACTMILTLICRSRRVYAEKVQTHVPVLG